MSLEFQYTLKRKNHNIVPDKTTSAFFVVPDSTHLPARPAGSSLARGLPRRLSSNRSVRLRCQRSVGRAQRSLGAGKTPGLERQRPPGPCGAMAPCESELLGHSVCVPSLACAALPHSCHRGCKRGAGLLSTAKNKFAGAHPVPYKKRKLRKSVKFSPASHFRVVECVPGEWATRGDSDGDSDVGPAGDDENQPPGSTAQGGSAHGSPCSADACAGGCASGPRADGESSADVGVLREQLIDTKFGDGPSTIGLICNALITGLVDRSIYDVDSAVDAMRAVLKIQVQSAAQASFHCADAHASSPAAPASPALAEGEEVGSAGDSELPVGEEVIASVLERLQQLVEHLDRHDKVGLLPSTARLGKPFIPALKCLQGTLRQAVKSQRGDGCEEDVVVDCGEGSADCLNAAADQDPIRSVACEE